MRDSAVHRHHPCSRPGRYNNVQALDGQESFLMVSVAMNRPSQADLPRSMPPRAPLSWPAYMRLFWLWPMFSFTNQHALAAKKTLSA